MGKRQKLILALYAFAVFILSFMYVPFVEYHSDGGRTYLGHHKRHRLQWSMEFKPMELRNRSIDSSLMVAEIIGLTAIAGSGILLLQKRKQDSISLGGPF
jgi:hypothetical protein